MEQENELGVKPIKKLLWKLAVPAITAQIVNVLYNVVDRIYIGHIPEVGKLALTGVGVCMPLIMLISAFAMLAGMGGAPRASIMLGRNDAEEAERILGNCAALLLLVAVTLTVLFQLFAKPFLLTFGASRNTIGFAMDYIRIYACGTIFVQLTLGLNAFITAQGFTSRSMAAVLIGALSNIILDPIFIFVFHWGVRGAAIATIASQAASAVFVVLFLCGSRTTLRLRREQLRPRWSQMGRALLLGLAPFIIQATEAVLNVAFNASLQKYGGDMAVGAMTVASTVMMMIWLPAHGIGQGAQPIISYNYGARNTARVRKTVRLLFVSLFAFIFVFWALAELLNPIVFDQIRSRATGVYVAPRTRVITGDDKIVRPEQIRVARRMIRDYRGRGHALRDTIERAQSVDRGEAQYIAPNKPNASIHIDTFHDYELCILAKYLREIPQFTSELDDAFIEARGLGVLMRVVRELPPLQTPYVPRDSLIREFVGGSCFQY